MNGEEIYSEHDINKLVDQQNRQFGGNVLFEDHEEGTLENDVEVIYQTNFVFRVNTLLTIIKITK
jgi:hypothetical protein